MNGLLYFLLVAGGALLVAAVVAVVVTPSSDPFSMLALAIPLVFFYFISIALGKILHR